MKIFRFESVIPARAPVIGASVSIIAARKKAVEKG